MRIYIVVWFMAFIFSLIITPTQLLPQSEAFLVIHTIFIFFLFFWLACKDITVTSNANGNINKKFIKRLQLALNFMFTIFTIFMIYLVTFISYFLLSFIVMIDFSITYEFISFFSFLIFFDFKKKENSNVKIIK